MDRRTLELMLSAACANGSSLEYVGRNIIGVPVIVRWTADKRATMCGPWSTMADVLATFTEYRLWQVFDYEFLDDALVLHVKKYERREGNGTGNTHTQSDLGASG